MRSAKSLILTAIHVLLAAPRASAGGLLGTQVTGSNELNFTPINVFDPASGFVPAGYLNDAGTTVTIANPAIEFGAEQHEPLHCELHETQLIVTDMASAPFGGTSFTMSFTDSAFDGLGVSKVSDNFTNGILAPLSTDTLLVTWSGTDVSQPTTFKAVFNIGPSAVPEPSSWMLYGTALAVFAPARAGGDRPATRLQWAKRDLGGPRRTEPDGPWEERHKVGPTIESRPVLSR